MEDHPHTHPIPMGIPITTAALLIGNTIGLRITRTKLGEDRKAVPNMLANRHIHADVQIHR